ncbi:MAG TPA: DUF190 domain-containing protein [Anaeromyxobacteraceae bacterium]|nr:DUF190 domain-containing protein [Anaeromyxobacteraceae bacterium]
MNLLGKVKRVRIYVGEDDRIGNDPAPQALLEFLRRENVHGATLLRAIGGFGGRGAVHSIHLLDGAARLPVVLEWIDLPEVVERVLPRLRGLLSRGLVTVDETEVVHQAGPSMQELSHGTTAGDVMSRDVTRVARDAPIRQVVEAVLGKLYRAVPVVEGGAPIGIITNSDLVTKGGLGVRLDLLKNLGKPELKEMLEALSRSNKVASDVMTPSPATVHVDTPLPDVASVMSRRHLKRLPVIDDQGAIVGMVSRLDLLRTASGGVAGRAPAPHDMGFAGDTHISKVMRRDVPLVHPDTPLPEVLQAVVATRLNRALVVDGDRRVIGIVTDAELLDRITPSLRPGALRSLMNRLPFAQPTPETAAQRAEARTAAELMSRHVAVAPGDTLLSDAIALVVKGNHKVLAVTDAEGRLAGIVDRADLLHGLFPTDEP